MDESGSSQTSVFVHTLTPMLSARRVGVVYLLYFVTAMLAAFLAKGLVVRADAAATATNILAHEASYRSAATVDLVANGIYLVVTALFYELFRPVNRNVSRIAAVIGAVGCGIQIFADMFRLAPLVILRDSQLGRVFGVDQVQGAALLSLELYAETFNISLVIFACYDILLGCLIFRSTFLPRAIGALLIVAGIGWLSFLWPPLAGALSAVVMPLGGIAEIVLMLWLVVKGARGNLSLHTTAQQTIP